MFPLQYNIPQCIFSFILSSEPIAWNYTSILRSCIKCRSVSHKIIGQHIDPKFFHASNLLVLTIQYYILPEVLYGCETWSLTLRGGGHRLRVFENRMWRRTFGPKRDAETGGWRKLHYEALHNLYSSPIIIIMIKSRRMRWSGHVAWMERRGTHIGYWWESH
jgi:hypothetical protein